MSVASVKHVSHDEKAAKVEPSSFASAPAGVASAPTTLSSAAAPAPAGSSKQYAIDYRTMQDVYKIDSSSFKLIVKLLGNVVIECPNELEEDQLKRVLVLLSNVFFESFFGSAMGSTSPDLSLFDNLRVSFTAFCLPKDHGGRAYGFLDYKPGKGLDNQLKPLEASAWGD